MKQWLHDFLSHPWVDCKEAADGADGRAECGKRGTSWGPSRYMYRYRKSATAVRRVTDVPTVLPSSIFDFVPGTSPSWSSKVYVSDGRTPYTPHSAPHSPRTLTCGFIAIYILYDYVCATRARALNTQVSTLLILSRGRNSEYQ